MADMDINYSGELFVPPCTVNSGNPVSVDFGEIIRENLANADTPYLAQDFPVALTCSDYISGLPQLTLTASAVHDAPSGTIQTSKYSEGLIIYLRQQGGVAPIPIGTPTDVSASMAGEGNAKTLTLNAAVGRYLAQEALMAGPFTATANLLVVYQ